MSPSVSPGALPGRPCCLEPCQLRERLWVCLPLLVIMCQRFVAAPRGLRHPPRSPGVSECAFKKYSYKMLK